MRNVKCELSADQIFFALDQRGLYGADATTLEKYVEYEGKQQSDLLLLLYPFDKWQVDGENKSRMVE